MRPAFAAGLAVAALAVALAAVLAPSAAHGEHVTWRVAIQNCGSQACLAVVEGPTASLPAGEEIQLTIRNDDNGTHALRGAEPGHGGDGDNGAPLVDAGALAPGDEVTVTFTVPHPAALGESHEPADEARSLRIWCSEPGHEGHAQLLLAIAASPPAPHAETPVALAAPLLACLGAARARRRSDERKGVIEPCAP